MIGYVCSITSIARSTEVRQSALGYQDSQEAPWCRVTHPRRPKGTLELHNQPRSSEATGSELAKPRSTKIDFNSLRSGLNPRPLSSLSLIAFPFPEVDVQESKSNFRLAYRRLSGAQEEALLHLTGRESCHLPHHLGAWGSKHWVFCRGGVTEGKGGSQRVWSSAS